MGHGDPGIDALDLDVGHQRAAFRPGGFRVDAAGRAQIGDVGGAEMLGLVRQARPTWVSSVTRCRPRIR